ncbi:hypothetical protein [Antribacter gilvus]|uniref:hypothetical protein n=1 Tax=Antribacter gilvus TaxID=2304675 RepID=UPI000F77B595|nr:hypothetical protein [Antribacter gilvus]
MNRQHDEWSDPTAGLLSRAMHEAADEMPETDLYTTAFERVRGRVRRRRAAKVGGLGAVSLAVAGALAVGASSILPDRTEPVVPATPTPSVTAPDPSDGAIREGHTPGWLAGTGLTCGMPEADLAAVAGAGEYSLDVTGNLTATATYDGSTPWAYRYALPVGLTAPVDLGDPVITPVLVWSVDGRVVDLGDDRAGAEPFGQTPSDRYNGAVGDVVSGCAVEGAAGTLGDGSYQVRALTLVHPISGADPELAVSDPVELVVEGGQVYQQGLASGIPMPVEFEVPPDARGRSEDVGQLVSASLVDRSGDRPQDVTFVDSPPADGGTYRIEARCTSTDPADVVTFQPFAGDAIAGGDSDGGGMVPSNQAQALEAPCDGTLWTSDPWASGDAAGLPVALHFREVPDGVVVAYARMVPTGGASAECSAGSAPDLGAPDLSGVPAAVADKASALYAAAVACDEAALVGIAQADDTVLSSGGVETDPAQVLAIPEPDDPRYGVLVRLLAGTRGEALEDGTWVWPRLQTGRYGDGAEADAAWAEVVSVGLVSPEDAAAMRSGGGYLGWRIGVTPDGTWQFFVGGD